REVRATRGIELGLRLARGTPRPDPLGASGPFEAVANSRVRRSAGSAPCGLALRPGVDRLTDHGVVRLFRLDLADEVGDDRLLDPAAALPYDDRLERFAVQDVETPGRDALVDRVVARVDRLDV